MKKISALLFLMVAFMALVACSGKTTTSPDSSPSPSAQSTTASQTEATTTYRTEIFTIGNGTVVQKDYYNDDKKLEKRETFYPENGLPKENVLYNEHEMAEIYELFTRGENGELLERCVEKGKYNKTGVDLEKKYVEIYNAKDILKEETVYTFNEQGIAANGNIKRYDDNGNKIYQGVMYFYFSNVCKEVNGTHFDTDGVITKKEKTEYDESGKLKALSVSEYNKDFVITKKTEQTYKSDTISSNEYLYDEDGDIKSGKEITLYLSEQISRECLVTYHKSSGEVATRTEYDENGEIFYYASFDENGARKTEVLSRNTDGKACWFYDKYSIHLIERAIYLKDTKELHSTIKYAYHENSRTKREDTYNAEGELIAYKEYDKYGKLTAQFPEAE